MSIDPTNIDIAKLAVSAMGGWSEPTLSSNDKSFQLVSHREKHRVCILFTVDTVSAVHDYLSAPFGSKVSVRSNWKKMIHNPSQQEIHDLVIGVCGRYFLNA